MGGDIVDTDGLDIVDGLGETMCGDIVGSACLKLKRQFLEYCLLECHALYHLSPTLIRRQTVEP